MAETAGVDPRDELVDEVIRLTADLTPASPCDPQVLAAAGQALGFEWPPDYVTYMVSRGGGAGFVGESYVDLWRADKLIELNRSYNPDDAPNLVLVGSDGGGEAFAYDRRRQPPSIVIVNFVGMNDLVPVADSFVAFLRRLERGRLFD